MKRKVLTIIVLAFFVSACGNSKKDSAGDLNDKKAELEKLKKKQSDINIEIAGLQKEIAKLDTSAKTGNAKLVAVAAIQPQSFTHYIDLQGRIDATNISYVAPPSGQPGIVTALYVKQGDYVRKGQALAKLDDQILRQSIEPIRVQLAAAEDTYRRMKNLFDQGVGIYQNVLNAKTQMENLQRTINTMQRQVSLTTVTAPSSGVADVVNVRVGESFMGTLPTGVQQIRIVNTGTLKVIADVPENYLGRVGTGSKVLITLPNLNDSLQSTVSVAGKIIDPSRRTFYIEAPVPSNPNFKPNQIAIVRVQDYSAPTAVTIPVNTLQNDDKGKFVMVAVKEADKLIARKRYVTVGELYGERLEVRSGLSGGEQLITEGFQSLYEGQLITLK